MAGALSYHLGRLTRDQPVRQFVDGIAVRVLLPATLIFILVPDLMNPFVPEQHRLKLLLLIALPSIPAWFEATRKIALDQSVGELSYPLYLVHTLIIFIVGGSTGSIIVDPSLRSLVMFAMSLLAAFGLFRFVEKPVNALRQKRVSSKSGAFDKQNS